MKKFFVFIAFAAIMGLSSCDKIYDEIDGLKDRVTELENTSIPTINEQISNINKSISYLEVVDTELNGYITALQGTSEKLQKDIDALDVRIGEVQTALETEILVQKEALEGNISTVQAELLAQLQSVKAELVAELNQINETIAILETKDAELEGKITELRSYVDKELSKTADWATATFATLEQYEALCADIAVIKTEIETLNNSITELESRLNEKIATDIAVAVEGLNGEIVAQVSAITTAYTTAIASAKEEVTAAYTTAISTAVSELETSMKQWVNEQLSNYYTIAQVDALLTAMREDFDGKLSAQKIYLESLISSLSNTLFVEIGKNSELITALRSDLTLLDAEVAQNAQAIADNAERISANANSIKANAEAILANAKQIETNKGSIEENATLLSEKIEASAAIMIEKIEANAALIAENKQLIAEVDAKIDNTSNVANAQAIADNAKAIANNAELIAQNSIAINNNTTAIATNAVEIEAIKEQILSVKEEITQSYTELIEISITTLEGKLDNSISEINAHFDSEIKEINNAIDALEARVDAIENEITSIKNTIVGIQNDITTIQGQISSLLSRIQSVTYVPQYSDGKATMDYGSKEAKLDFMISPRSAVVDLATLWNSALNVKAIYTQTRATNFIDLPIKTFEADYDNGVISITVSGENLGENFYTEQQDASLFLQISDGNSHISSDYVAMTPNYNIQFEDLRVKAICRRNWDTNGDAELSYAEAAAVTNIGTAFKNDSNIVTFTELKYFTGINQISTGAFMGCRNLWKINLPENIDVIATNAFSGCKSLTNILLPQNIISIDFAAFSSCTSLKEIIFPRNLTYIGQSAFSMCTGLKQIIIPDNVASIGHFAFRDCTNVEYVYVGNGVADIGKDPFCDCKGVLIYNSTLPDQTSYGLFPSSKFTKAIFGGRAVKIGGYIFVDEDSYGGQCHLKTLILEESVKNVANYAFYIDSLDTVYCKSTTPPQIGGYTFENTIKKIYVPVGCIDVYKKGSFWSGFSSKIEEYDFENNPI